MVISLNLGCCLAVVSDNLCARGEKRGIGVAENNNPVIGPPAIECFHMEHLARNNGDSSRLSVLFLEDVSI